MNELTWRKSSRSGDWGDCVEVAAMSDAVAVRDSKAPHAGHVCVTGDDWKAFLSQVKAGHYNT